MSEHAASPAVKIFADGADLDGLIRLAADERIKGFTTNPTLMRKAGVTDYAAFCEGRARTHHGSTDLIRGVH